MENQRSPCERLVTDYVPFYELLEVLAEEVAVSTFVSRVCRLTGRGNPRFFENGHRERFLAMGEKCSRAIGEAATCSAVYLLSADRFLCSRALAAIDQEEIHFSKIHIHGVDLDGYVLFHMARDLYQGSRHVRLSELTDPELVSDRIFEWIMTACVIRRHVKVLLAGGKIPFFKQPGKWQISLSALTEKGASIFLETGKDPSLKNGTDDRGLDYQDWLKLFFLIQGKSRFCYRMMDMIQNRISEKEPGFRMDQCQYGVSVSYEAQGTLIPLRRTSQKEY